MKFNEALILKQSLLFNQLVMGIMILQIQIQY